MSCNIMDLFPQLFDESWHKVTIGVAQDQATLYVDCEPVQGLFGEYYTPLEPRGPVDATGGYLSVARQVARPISVPVSDVTILLEFSFHVLPSTLPLINS